MVSAGDVLDLGPLGAVFHVQRTAAETRGASFDMEWVLAPRTGGTPEHVHPHAVETYEVAQGRLDLFVDGAWKTLEKGEQATVEKGVPHTFRNASDAQTRVLNRHLPAMRFGDYFEGLAKLVAQGAIRSERPDLKAMLHLAAHMSRFPEEIKTTKPPYPVIRALGALGRGLGCGVKEGRP